jgi:hypothetical protein
VSIRCRGRRCRPILRGNDDQSGNLIMHLVVSQRPGRDLGRAPPSAIEAARMPLPNVCCAAACGGVATPRSDEDADAVNVDRCDGDHIGVAVTATLSQRSAVMGRAPQRHTDPQGLRRLRYR